MDYEGQICRSPMERSSFMLPVTAGCSYNACKFCALFKHLTYRVLPLEQVEAELKRVKSLGGSPEKIFLGDGDAFGLDTEHLLNILRLIHQYFPNCTEINMDATITNVHNKSDSQLKALAHAGVRYLYLGIESGLDDVLSFMRKDHSLSQAYREIDRLQQAGLLFAAHMMTGVAGKERGLENAEKTAEFFNRTTPARIVNFSMFLHNDSPLWADYEAGIFIPADEVENLKEERRLLALIQTEHLEYEGFHDYIKTRIRGTLPADRDKMIQKLDVAIARYEGTSPGFANIPNCGCFPTREITVDNY